VAVNLLKSKLASGQVVFGIWSIIPSPILSEVIGHAGMDFQILDGEHGLFTDLQALDNAIRASESAGCAPIVRSPGLDQYFVQSALDLGAHGIVIPQVAGYAQAETAAKLTKYGPAGVRGFNPFTRAGGYGFVPRGETSRQDDEFVFSGVNIENLSAYRELDRIVAIPGLDMLYLGIYDMSIALGCAGDTNHPKVNEFVEVAARKIRDAGKVVGLLVKNEAEIRKYLGLGANLMVWWVDTFVIHRAFSEAVGLFRSLAGRTD
jgi:4-hydroxy-2-oxoheptanedioate aldolase